MKRKERHIIFSVLLIAALFILVIYTNQSVKEKVCIEDKGCFSVEFAETAQERAQGLSNKDSLNENSGMLFIFPEPDIVGFWAKEMEFPIDVIWIGPDMRILGFEKYLQPCETIETCPTAYPNQEIMYVLEINAGLADSYGFEKGDFVYFIVPENLS